MSMTMTLTVKTKFDYFMSPCAVHRLVFFMQTFRQRPTLQPAFTASQSHTHSLTPTVSISDELYHSVTSYLGISCPDKLHQSSLKPATKLQLLLVLHSVTVSVNAILTNDNVTNVINSYSTTVSLPPPRKKKKKKKDTYSTHNYLNLSIFGLIATHSILLRLSLCLSLTHGMETVQCTTTNK